MWRRVLGVVNSLCFDILSLCSSIWALAKKRGPSDKRGLRNEVPASTVVFTLVSKKSANIFRTESGDSWQGRHWGLKIPSLQALLPSLIQSFRILQYLGGEGRTEKSTHRKPFMSTWWQHVNMMSKILKVKQLSKILKNSVVKRVSPVKLESYESDYIVWDLLNWYQSGSLAFPINRIGHRPDKKTQTRLYWGPC